MKAVFTVGGTSTTLADYTATPALNGVIEQSPFTAVVEVVPLYGAAAAAIFPRGNASGRFVFSVFASHGSYDNWQAAIKAAQALVGQQGALVVTPNVASSTVLYTLNNATLRGVQPLDWGGVGGRLRYTFDYASIS
jgi:hypothetical protein